jgi:hypothetical protein
VSGAVDPDDTTELRSRLATVADRVRHPNLLLARFLSREAVYNDDSLIDIDDDESQIPAAELEPARLRRAALLVAAEEIIDRCIDDLQLVEFDEDGRPADLDEAEDTFVFEAFPARYRDAYDEQFFRNVLVTAIKVAQDLADPDGGPAACTAEEIIRRAVGTGAEQWWEITDLGPAILHPDELLLEDTDFEFLYEDAFDGLENSPADQARMNVDVPGIQDWFTPFNDDRVVHPYTETTRSTGQELHDLRRRLRGLSEPVDHLLPADLIDATHPLTSLAPGSEIVALARRTSDRDAPDLWTADETTPETSFAALVDAASRAEAGSGWLTWEPHQGADTVRIDSVVSFTPHRHFPIGDDEPWADAAIGGGRMVAVPLRYVVSYRPDPDVRRRWNDTFKIPQHDPQEEE